MCFRDHHYPISAKRIYTDGYVFRATKFAGYGVSVSYPDEVTHVGKKSFNYEAEFTAIIASPRIWADKKNHVMSSYLVIQVQH